MGVVPVMMGMMDGKNERKKGFKGTRGPRSWIKNFVTHSSILRQRLPDSYIVLDLGIRI